jgi:hypothetical protein
MEEKHEVKCAKSPTAFCCWYPITGEWLAAVPKDSGGKPVIDGCRKTLRSKFPHATNIRYEEKGNRKVFHLSFVDEKERDSLLESEQNREPHTDRLRVCVNEREQLYPSCGVDLSKAKHQAVLVFRHPRGFFRGSAWQGPEQRNKMVQEAMDKLKSEMPNMRVDCVGLRLPAHVRRVLLRVNSRKDMLILRDEYRKMEGLWGAHVSASFDGECEFECGTKHEPDRCWMVQPALACTIRFKFSQKVFSEWVTDFSEEAKKRGAVRVFSGVIPTIPIIDQAPSYVVNVEWQRIDAEKNVENTRSAIAALTRYALENGGDVQRVEEVNRHTFGKQCTVCGEERHGDIRYCVRDMPADAGANNVQSLALAQMQPVMQSVRATTQARVGGALARPVSDMEREEWRWCMKYRACHNFFSSGRCRFGAQCRYLHGDRLKVEVLPVWVNEAVRPRPRLVTGSGQRVAPPVLPTSGAASSSVLVPVLDTEHTESKEEKKEKESPPSPSPPLPPPFDPFPSHSPLGGGSISTCCLYVVVSLSLPHWMPATAHTHTAVRSRCLRPPHSMGGGVAADRFAVAACGPQQSPTGGSTGWFLPSVWSCCRRAVVLRWPTSQLGVY